MEPYLKITFLNDFLFCPLSIYYHGLYGQLSTVFYHDKPQIDGKAAHETIDTATYSTHKDILQGVEVFSDEYNLCGCIDIFDIKQGILTERKKKIKKVYDGYVFQLFAQYFALSEMGYTVKKIRLFSKDDNRVFNVKLPGESLELKKRFEETVQELHSFDPGSFSPESKEKCENCIYSTFCDRSLNND